jgi:catechol 2,3-dioxygenase
MVNQNSTDRKILFEVRRLGHVNLFVSDIDTSVNFYRGVVGLGVAWRRSNMCTGFLSNGNTHHDIGLIDLHGPLGQTSRATLNHLAFEVETQVDLVDGYRRAKSQGFPFTAMYDHEISHSLYFDDVDGTQIEIYADTDVDWQERLVNPIKPSLDKWEPGKQPPSPKRYYRQNPVFMRQSDAIFHPTKVTHAALYVRDLEAAEKEYQCTLGLSSALGSVKEGFVSLAGSCGDRDLTLVQADRDHPPGLAHFGFQAWAEDDLRQSVTRARSEGVAIESELQDAHRYSVMFRDPDGFLVQIYADRKPLDMAVGVPRPSLMHLV